MRENKTLIIIIAVVIAVLFLYWQFDYSKKAKEIKELKVKQEEVTRKLESARQVAQTLAQTKREIKKMEQQLKIVNKMLPEEENISEILRDISRMGGQYNIKSPLFKPLGKETTQYYNKYKYKVSFVGSYDNVGLFFSHILNMSRILKIKDLEIKATQDNKVSVTCQLEAFTQSSGKVVADNSKKKKK